MLNFFKWRKEKKDILDLPAEFDIYLPFDPDTEQYVSTYQSGCELHCYLYSDRRLFGEDLLRGVGVECLLSALVVDGETYCQLRDTLIAEEMTTGDVYAYVQEFKSNLYRSTPKDIPTYRLFQLETLLAHDQEETES